MTTQGTRRQPPSQLKVFSPAKLNLYLRIIDKRSDGYHDIETIMAPLDFGDEVTLQLRKTSIVIESNHPTLPIDNKNLALKAAQLFDESFSFEKGVKILLKKRIPLAAGLGGGSSNAASVLTGLNRLWKAGADEKTLSEIALSIGSDVPFFIYRTPAICKGRGDRIEPIPCKLSATVLLVNPGFGISTKWAYDHFHLSNHQSYPSDHTLTVRQSDVTLLLQGLASDDIEAVSRGLFNSLEAASIAKYSILQLIKDELLTVGALGALMSGSGATVFGLFANEETAQEAILKIREQFGSSIWVQLTRFLNADES